MDQLLASLPKSVIALGALIIGFALIMFSDPPRTVCDAQMEIFRASQKRFLYSRKMTTEGQEQLVERTMKELLNRCKEDGSPGGCFDLFVGLKKLSADLDNMPKSCGQAAAGDAQIQGSLWTGLGLMTQLAWGDRVPASFGQRHGWFDASDIVLFCDLKRNAITIFGNDTYNQWREGVMTTLPGADRAGREAVWQKSLLSIPCESYR